MPVALPAAVFVSLPALVSVLCAALPTSPAASFTSFPAFLSVWCTLAPTFFSVCACAAGAVTTLPASPAPPANAATIRNLEIRIPHPLVRSVHGRAAADRLRVAGSSEPPLPPLRWKCKRRAQGLRPSRSHFSASFGEFFGPCHRAGTILVYVPGHRVGRVGWGRGAGRGARQSDQKSTKDCRSQFERSPGSSSDSRCTMGFQFNCRRRSASAVLTLAAAGFALLAVSPRVAAAQGVLRGVLYDDASGTPIRGTVMLVDPATDAAVVYNATDSLGRFNLQAQTGIY